MNIEQGMPATECLVSDTYPHVVTRVSDKSIWTRRVAHGEKRTAYMKGPFPVIEADGLLDQPEGPEVRWTRAISPLGNEYGKRGSIILALGRSDLHIDYSY